MANILRETFDSKDSWNIKQVTVYEDRAQVTRILDYKTRDTGEVELRLENLPVIVQADSVSAEVETHNASIVEVAHDVKTSYGEHIPVSEREHEISKEIAKLSKERNLLNTRKQWFTSYSNKLVPQQNSLGVNHKGNKVFDALVGTENLSNFEEALEKYTKEIETIDERLHEIQCLIQDLQEEKNKIATERNAAIQAKKITASEISVILKVPEKVAENAEIVTIRLTYAVTSCSWKASYDLRVNKAESLLQLSYYGKITNSTKEDWNDVQIFLSTAKPSRAGNLEALPRAEVKLQKNRGIRVVKEKGNVLGGLMGRAKRKMMRETATFGTDAVNEERMAEGADELDMVAEEEEEEEAAEQLEQIVAFDDTETETKGGTATFKLKRLCTIESDDKPHKQSIGLIKLKASFTYVLSPKVSLSCYLRCSAKNTSKYVLITGPMSVFFNGTFVTTTTMNLVNQNEKFMVYLGQEDSVSIDYQPEIKKTEKIKKGLLTSRVNVQTVNRKIVVKNTREEDIDCLLFEQIPSSRHTDIKVELLSPDVPKDENAKKKKGYKINDMNHLEARKVIKAQKAWTLDFNYKVEWPDKREIMYGDSLE